MTTEDTSIDITSGPDVADGEDEELTRDSLIDIIRQQAAALANASDRHGQDIAAAEKRGIDAVLSTVILRLDEIDMALHSGALEGADSLKSTVASLQSDLKRYGLSKVGEVGERFDPEIHEVLGVSEDTDVEYKHPTVVRVLRPGWVADGRLLRAAGVVVVRKPSASQAQAQ